MAPQEKTERETTAPRAYRSTSRGRRLRRRRAASRGALRGARRRSPRRARRASSADRLPRRTRACARRLGRRIAAAWPRAERRRAGARPPVRRREAAAGPRSAPSCRPRPERPSARSARSWAKPPEAECSFARSSSGSRPRPRPGRPRAAAARPSRRCVGSRRASGGATRDRPPRRAAGDRPARHCGRTTPLRPAAANRARSRSGPASRCSELRSQRRRSSPGRRWSASGPTTARRPCRVRRPRRGGRSPCRSSDRRTARNPDRPGVSRTAFERVHSSTKREPSDLRPQPRRTPRRSSTSARSTDSTGWSSCRRAACRPPATRRAATRCNRSSEHRDTGPDRDRAQFVADRLTCVLPQCRAGRSPAARRGGRSRVPPPEARRLRTHLRLGRAAGTRTSGLGRGQLRTRIERTSARLPGGFAQLRAERADGRGEAGRRRRSRAGGYLVGGQAVVLLLAFVVSRPRGCDRRRAAARASSPFGATGLQRVARSPRRSSSCSPQRSSGGCWAPAQPSSSRSPTNTPPGAIVSRSVFSWGAIALGAPGRGRRFYLGSRARVAVGGASVSVAVVVAVGARARHRRRRRGAESLASSSGTGPVLVPGLIALVSIVI